MFKLVAILTALVPVLALGNGPWPMERQDRFGTARITTGPATYTQPWIKRKLPAEVASHGPSLGAGSVGFYTSWVDERMYKFNSGSGDLLGHFVALNWCQSTPAISSDGATAYVTTVKPYSFSPPGRLFSINTNTLDFNWFFNTNFEKQNDFDSCSPIIGPDGDVIVGSTTGHVWRIDDITGSPVWTRSGLSGVIHTCAFSRDDSTVIVSNGSNVSGINYLTGTVTWTRPLGSTAGTPAVSPGGTILVGSEAGTIYGLNAATGAIIWTKATLAPVRGAASFSQSGLVTYVASEDQRLYAMRVSDGFSPWTYVSGTPIRNSVSVGADGRIYFGAGDRLFSVRMNGTLAWSVNFPGGQFRGPVTIGADGMVYCGLNAGPSYMAMVSQQPIEVFPTSASIVNGGVLSGGIANLFVSDDTYFAGEVGFATNPPQPNIRMQVDFTSPTRGLNKLTINVEASASRQAPQLLKLYNFSTNQYETVASTTATGTDVLTTAVIETNASRYVNQGSKVIRLLVGFESDVPNIDTVLFGYVDKVSATLEPAFEH